MPYLDARFTSRNEADLAVQVLSSEGVQAWVSASDAGGAIPAMQTVGAVRIEVAARDLDRATALLEGTDLGKPAVVPPLTEKERVQSWAMGIFFAVVLGLMLWQFASYVPDPEAVERSRPPPQHELPF